MGYDYQWKAHGAELALGIGRLRECCDVGLTNSGCCNL